ncbi:MAG: N-acetylmuramoyl-L-alanine amidase family protein [Bacillota bacterium]
MVPQVMLDPGHGGDDPGATGANGLLEKDLNLAVALKARAHLGRRQFFSCALTRQADVPVDLLKRSDMTNADPANVLFVSIHHNGATDPRARGSEIFYQFRSPDSAAFAAILERQMAAKINLPWRRTVFRLNAAGTADYYSVLRNTRCPAVIVEIGFVTCPEEAPTLRENWFQELAALAIADAVEQWMHHVWRGA